MPDKSSDEALKGIVSLLHGMEVHTITYDNGLEFARHGLVNELLECERLLLQTLPFLGEGWCGELQRSGPTVFPQGV